ncbi:MAG: NAD(P)H-dependent oxidoreductase subunit E [Deltaproteobacteria bacterium]|nr:NAD(P)H-dependent oxidoreductase subunit E [Deltaproteobacteria bacterium]
MGKVHVVIDGREVTGEKGETILKVARREGVDIPTLCHREEITPSGVCRICVVEVEGLSRLVASCHTPISDGMIIHTASPKVLLSRRVTLELLMAGHSGSCVEDPLADSCELHQLASKMEMGPPRFSVKHPRIYPMEVNNPYVVRDLSKCILCRRCVGACDEVAQQSVFSIGYRGVHHKIIVGADGPLDCEVCRDCGVCIDFCPTNALKPAAGRGHPDVPNAAWNKGGSRSMERPSMRKGLLEELKKEQIECRFVSEAAMARLKEHFHTTLGEVYGLTTFYSFLSTKPTGRNIIRVCKSLPCFLKNGILLLKAIKKAIGIGPGETTVDGRFSLELTNCIGACDRAPAIMVNHDVYGDVTEEKIPGILEDYK